MEKLKEHQKLELLDSKKIRNFLAPHYHSYLDKLAIFQEIPSTNAYLFNAAQNNNYDIRICLAEKQTAGYGRFGKSWVSPFASNIYLSLLWTFNIPAQKLSGIGLVSGLAVLKSLQKYGITTALALKWPNDVLWRGRKLAGILIETIAKEKGCYDLVIGIGLNVFMSKEIGAKIQQPWVDIAEIVDEIPDRNKILGFLLESLFKNIPVFEQHGLNPFIEEWQNFDSCFNQKIMVLKSSEKIVGIGRGINEDGHLLLQDEKGMIQTFTSGEISVLCA